ncbi:MAG: putative baseplate assembly protein [Aromatoleum sp.]|jgi:predicted phage baseplate assembly protein|uniref:putative baseplate assembly protein n=1 Tax=Aromatoleum sp. TaxID=2307007 RepID=UPI002894F2CE|nr:putative baseplate assembly protein [Aromatoleum sp.]MDT3671285.1 putative baseplate assembly protein [Aromatoleum sp.]
MPLKDALPVIDDRRYGDILAEIRSRIARYTPEWKPEWSDVNDNDPGMILAQVFAWLSEMLIFRMARVPQLNYVKFLELIGIELMPALPARADVSFAVDETWPLPTVIVPARTQVSAAADEGPPIVFETERPLTAVACRLLAVQAYDGAVYDDVSAANVDVSPTPARPAPPGFAPFGDAPRDDAALVLGFGFPPAYPTPDQFPTLSLDLAFWAFEQPQDALTVQCAPATRAYAPARLEWEGWDGAAWQRVDALNDETLAFTRSGHVVLRLDSALQLARSFLGEYDTTDPVTKQPREPLFWLRARLTRNQYERAPRLAAVRTNTVPALQAQTVQREILGGTTGARNQTFQIENTPLVQGSLVIEIDEGIADDAAAALGATARRWAVAEDLFGAGPTDEVLAVNWTSGEVRAGDGEHGQIPVANADNPDTNVVAVEYRFGGGKRGNVAAAAIATLVSPIDGLDGDKTTNIFAAYGGRDEERFEEAQVRARRTLRARERAVSVDDFELLAQQAGNVKRAKALPLAHPRFPGVAVPGAVTVIVVPDAEGPNPLPSDGLLRTVCEYLDARRLLTTELFVVAPRYVAVAVDAQVVVDDRADPAAVKQAVENTLASYLHPLRGGDDGSGWPFGGALRYSKIVQQVFAVAGVDSVPRLVLTVEGDEQPECRDVAISAFAANALVTVAGLRVEVLTAFEFEGAQR